MNTPDVPTMNMLPPSGVSVIAITPVPTGQLPGDGDSRHRAVNDVVIEA